MRERRPRIVVVGSTMTDLISYADPLPREGQTVTGREFRLGFGGKGANQAVMAARLGAEVVFVNCVGDDVFGEMTIANLEAQGVATSSVRRVDGASTGVAPIWVDGAGNNRIIVIPGANDALDAACVRAELERLDSADCVVCQLEVPLDAVREAFHFGRAWGCPTILNPAPVPAAPLDDELLELADWLIPNESEFELLFGRTPDSDAIANVARPRLVVTLGAKGAATRLEGALHTFAPQRVAAVDTTGAGDAFVGGFAFGLASGEDVPRAIELGNTCGALSVTAHGTQSSFPSRSAVADLLPPERGATRVD